jgi:hypothetical protein
VGLAALAYVALPVGLFLAGWLRPAWAIPLVTALLLGTAAWGRRILARGGAVDPPSDRPVSVVALVSAVLVVAVMVALLGPGGAGIQRWDWDKHNAILKDLIVQPWPVAYATGVDDVALTYYVAYYLPAAVVGKAAGWVAANLALFAWTAVGAALAFLWIVALSGGSVWRCLAIFVLFSGLDLVGAAVWSTRWQGAAPLDPFDAEWWAKWWTLPNNLTLLSYAPHQAIGAWLLTGLVLAGLRQRPGRSPHVLSGALGLLWSPFAVVGLAALAALDWGTAWRQRGGWRGLGRDGAELCGGLVGAALVVYFLSRAWPVVLPPRYYPPADRISAAGLAFLPAQFPWRAFAAEYAVFVGLEFLVLAALLAATLRGHRDETRLLGVATATLLVLPLFRYGYHNDLVMRASIPALFVLQVLAARATGGLAARPALAVAVAALLLLGALYPANMLRLNALAVLQRGALVRIPRGSGVPDLFEQQLALRGYYFHVGQYIGSVDAPFFRVLARRPVPAPRGSGGEP